MLAGSGEWELGRQVWRRQVVRRGPVEGQPAQVPQAREPQVRGLAPRQPLVPWQLQVRLQLREVSAPGQCRPRRS